jgi:hypothetical protein
MSKAVGGTSSIGRCVMRLLSLAVVGSLLSGCATIVSGSRQKVDIITSEEGAKVEIINQNNNKVFESTTTSFPTTARLKRGDGFFSGAEYRVEISKEGSEKRTAMLQTDLNAVPYIPGNILLGGWLGILIVDPATGAMWKFKQPVIHADLNTGVVTRYSRSDGYFAARYVMPMGGMPSSGAINLESGWIWGNGTFFGIDIDAGYSDYEPYKNGERWGMMLGGGFNLGGVYDLPVENLQLAFGGGAGFWWVDYGYQYEKYDVYGYYSGYYDEWKTSFNFLAPFIKLRWNFIELTYRGLLGFSDNGSSGDYYGDYSDGKSGFGWNNHQIMVGIHLASDNRWKGKPNNR